MPKNIIEYLIYQKSDVFSDFPIIGLAEKNLLEHVFILSKNRLAIPHSEVMSSILESSYSATHKRLKTLTNLGYLNSDMDLADNRLKHISLTKLSLRYIGLLNAYILN